MGQGEVHRARMCAHGVLLRVCPGRRTMARALHRLLPRLATSPALSTRQLNTSAARQRHHGTPWIPWITPASSKLVQELHFTWEGQLEDLSHKIRKMKVHVCVAGLSTLNCWMSNDDRAKESRVERCEQILLWH